MVKLVRTLAAGVAANLLVASAPAGATDNARIDPVNLLAMVQADWNADGRKDKALLMASEEDASHAELRIYLTDSSVQGIGLVSRHDNIAWRGTSPASQPLLSASNSGLVLRSGNAGEEDNDWHQVLSIGLREGKFIVTRYTMTLHDRRNVQSGFRCDLNLLTRSGIRNTSSLQAVPQAVSLQEWRSDTIPAECRHSE